MPLYGKQTDVAVTTNDENEDVLDEKVVVARGLEKQVLSPGGDEQLEISFPAPTGIGAILISTDGTNFVVQQPLISDQGWLFNNTGILLIPG